MAIGIQQDAGSVSTWAGNICLEIERVMDQTQHFKAFLDATSDAVLTASPYNFAQTDVNNLRSAFSDLDQLRTIYQGAATLATAKDFRTFAKLLRGVSCW